MKKKKTIAFMTNEIEDDYHELLMRGVNDSALKHNVNLIIVVGKDLKSDIIYDKSYNIGYDFANNDMIDGIIISSGAMIKYAENIDIYKMFDRYKIPKVSISLPTEIYCMTDNISGFKKVINHLIKNHSKRSIVFVSGPETQEDARDRFDAYLSVLEENDIPFDPKYIIKGDFSYYSAVIGMKNFLQKGIYFDSVVCSNDEMATGVIKVLKDSNINIPEDVAVVGFDNVLSAQQNNLTTVNQPIYEMGYTAVDLIVGNLEGKKIKSVVLNSEIIIRESCGCTLSDNLISSQNFSKIHYNSNFADSFISLIYKDIRKIIDINDFKTLIINILEYLESNDEIIHNDILNLFTKIIYKMRDDDCFLFHKIIQKLKYNIDLLKVNKSQLDYIFSNMVNLLIEEYHKRKAYKNRGTLDSIRILRHVLLALISKFDVIENIGELFFDKLNDININNLIIYIYDNSFEYNQNTNLYENPKDMNLLVSKDMKLPKKIKSSEILSLISNDKRGTYILLPLFFYNRQLGVILYEYPDCWNENSMYETLSVEFACVIKISEMLKEHNKIECDLNNALNEFKKYNDKLNYLSFRDELTGLYNRRGFIKYSKLALEKTDFGKGIIIFGDLDGLKKINDSYGHNEGDNAIKKMAEILVQVFKGKDVVARLGGDEFTVLTLVDDSQNEISISNKIKDLLEQYNKSTTSYKLSISIGIVEFDIITNKLTFEELLKNADSTLYKNKYSKKQDIDKNPSL